MRGRDRDAKHIVIRNWDDIRTAWLDYIPNHDSPWPIPEHELHELPSLREELTGFPKPHKRDIKTETIEHEISGLRAAVLHEATILMLKASHVLRAMDEEACHGYRTWSRSTAYHSAFFAMRGVLGLLGLVIVPSGDPGWDFQVDIWAPRQKKNPSPSECEFATRVMPRSAVRHKEMWSIFHHVLCASKVGQSIWPYAGNDILKKLNVSSFTSLRHRLHYRSTGWIFNDLTDNSSQEDLIGLADDVLQLRYLVEPENESFPLSLALHLLSLGIALLSDLGKETGRIQSEVDRAKAWMDGAAWGCANVFEEGRTGQTG